jgi:hypothetical protein
MAEKTISKNEAVRLAIVELGQQATRGQIQALVKERFGLEMSPNHVSAARVAALRKLQAAPQPEAQPAAAAPAPARGTKNGGQAAVKPQPVEGEKITKKEAVRRALAALGKKAKPTAIQGWIKDTLHIDMTTAHISTTKGDLLRKAKKPPAKKPVASPQPRGQAAPAPPRVKAANGKGSTVEMADILKLKDLVRRVGAAHLRTLIDLMSK